MLNTDCYDSEYSSVFLSNCLINITKNTTFTQNNVLFTVPQQLFVVCQKEGEVELLLGQKWRLHYQMKLEQVLTLSHLQGLELMPTV